jgi:hypothetical protein
MDHLNFAEFDNEIINVNKITKITYDESIDKYAISIEGEQFPTMINKTVYEQFKDHLKKTCRSYFTEL